MVAISTVADEAQCGYPFALGEQYLIYGYSSDDSLHAGLWNLRNNLLEAANGDIEQLGDPSDT